MTEPEHIAPSPVTVGIELDLLRSWIEAMRMICAPMVPFRFDKADMMAHIIQQNAATAADIAEQMMRVGYIDDVVPPEIKLWEKP
jgi:hypothetical protein